MTEPPRRWSATKLLLSWLAYWTAVTAIKLGPGLRAAWRASNGPEGQGDINVSFGSAGIHIGVTQFGPTTWSGTASLLTLALWIAGPPLALWSAWMFANSRPQPDESPPASALSEAAADLEVGRRQQASEAEQRRS